MELDGHIKGQGQRKQKKDKEERTKGQGHRRLQGTAGDWEGQESCRTGLRTRTRLTNYLSSHSLVIYACIYMYPFPYFFPTMSVFLRPCRIFFFCPFPISTAGFFPPCRNFSPFHPICREKSPPCWWKGSRPILCKIRLWVAVKIFF